jgi:hypothetical protein
MRNIKYLSVTALLAVLSGSASQAQRVCGNEIKLTELRTQQPAVFEQMRTQRQKEILEAKQSGVASKTTAQYAIPVVFHFVLTPNQYSYLGNDTGIRRRVKSQLAHLNSDFNRHNADSSTIPGAFKPVYTSVGIQFGLTNTSSSKTISPGIEIKVDTGVNVPEFDANVDCYKAKHNSTKGLDAWDPDKYLNVWVGNITSGGSGTVVGITTPPSNVGVNIGGHTITADEKGLVINYGSFGAREFPAQNFIAGTDLGRTMTHEMGHYFELWHTWGDDGGLCPDNGGFDDDIADTPPEADAQYCNAGLCPTFPKLDACSNTSPGIMFMNYMDYVDDKAMVMFTIDQAARMQFYLQNESSSLTQHPELLKVSERILAENVLRVTPNPASTMIRLEVTGAQHLQQVELVNALGQSVYHVTAKDNQSLNIQRQGWAPGVYYLHCQFAEGMLSKKIVFE